MYNDEDYLKISGIQHYSFCRRQWALIHIEQQWVENSRTVEGKYMHSRVDNPLEREKRGDIITLRSVGLSSKEFGFYGVADIVEYRKVGAGGVVLAGYPGVWMPYPVEYKRGEPKEESMDEVQLCIQALCLEEAHGICIEEGALFYGEIKRRVKVAFDERLREETVRLANEMHRLFLKGETPPPEYGKHCRACSLVDICLPKELGTTPSVLKYLKKGLEE